MAVAEHTTNSEEAAMSDTLRKVDYFHVMVPNSAGQGVKILSGLAASGVNLLAFSGFPDGRRAQLDLFPEDSAKLKRAAKKLGLDLSAKKTGFLYHGDDRVGAMLRVFETLAEARINVTAVDAVTSGKGRFGAIFWVKPKSVAKAARLLRAR
jgi:prephenate dehydratase